MSDLETQFEQLREGIFYDIQLTLCEAGENLKIIKGQVKKKILTTFSEQVDYDSDTEVVERNTYLFFMNQKRVGTLLIGDSKKQLYLRLNNGKTIRVGCSVSIHARSGLLF